jgi:PIN domain nuclease of toxin-antitoxin system
LKLLLDTHAALWWLADDDRFGQEAEAYLDDADNAVLLSAVVVWEVALKRSLGKLQAPKTFAETLLEGGVTPLPVDLDHAAAVAELPWHHRDPFDRLLIVQARIENAVVVTSDHVFHAYGVPVVW